MKKVILKANKRTDISKTSVKAVRNSGRVPGVVYSKHIEPIAFDVTEGSIKPLVFTSKTHLISLNIGEMEAIDCVIKDIQFDPVTDKIVHFDLQALKAKEKIQLDIPVHLLGTAPGIKEGGVLQHSMHKLSIECFPVDIPESLEVDISKLNIGDSIHVSDISFENIEILTSEDSTVVAIMHPKVEEVAVEEDILDEEPAEPELIGKKKEEEEEE